METIGAMLGRRPKGTSRDFTDPKEDMLGYRYSFAERVIEGIWIWGNILVYSLAILFAAGAVMLTNYWWIALFSVPLLLFLLSVLRLFVLVPTMLLNIQGDTGDIAANLLDIRNRYIED